MQVLWHTRKGLQNIIIESRELRRGWGKKRRLGDTARASEFKEGV